MLYRLAHSYPVWQVRRDTHVGCNRSYTQEDHSQVTTSIPHYVEPVVKTETALDTTAQFVNTFDANRQDVREVVKHATGQNFIYRVGATHQMHVGLTVANTVGSHSVWFEAPVDGKHAVDVAVTTGGKSIAIECKASLNGQLSATSVYKGITQCETYLQDGYQAAIVVCPNGSLTGAAQQAAANRAEFSDVRVCELHELPDILRELS